MNNFKCSFEKYNINTIITQKIVFLFREFMPVVELSAGNSEKTLKSQANFLSSLVFKWQWESKSKTI